MKRLKARFKLWFSTGDVEGVFGDGKWRLLKAIEKEGSLRAASEKLGISYRKAWGDLRKAEDTLNIALVERRRGGRSGGRTNLTNQGESWLKAYSEFRSDIERAAEKAYERYFGSLGK